MTLRQSSVLRRFGFSGERWSRSQKTDARYGASNPSGVLGVLVTMRSLQVWLFNKANLQLDRDPQGESRNESHNVADDERESEVIPPLDKIPVWAGSQSFRPVMASTAVVPRAGLSEWVRLHLADRNFVVARRNWYCAINGPEKSFAHPFTCFGDSSGRTNVRGWVPIDF